MEFWYSFPDLEIDLPWIAKGNILGKFAPGG